MKKSKCALWIAFAVAVGVGYGCNSSDSSSTPNPSAALDGKTYTEKYTCNETFGGPLSCPDLNETDVIIFSSTGGNNYEGRDVPDTGFVYTGTLLGYDLNWTATSPFGYVESGTWTFSFSFDSFSGSSHYAEAANPPSYSGDCNTNGVLAPGIPADPPLPTGCP